MALSFSFKLARKLAALRLRPHTRLAWITLYLAGIEALLLLLNWAIRLAGKSAAGTSLPGWTTFLGWVFAFFFLIVTVRWFRKHVMWRLRNQLIVTYVLIGAVPLLLMAVIAIRAGSAFLGQFASFLAVAEIQAQVQRLAATNNSAAEQIIQHGAKAEELVTGDPFFRARSIITTRPSEHPPWVRHGFAGLISDGQHFHLRAVHFTDTSRGPISVMSTVPVDERMLAIIASGFGQVTLSHSNLSIHTSQNAATDESLVAPLSEEHLTAGTIPPPINFLDRQFDFYALVPVKDWSSGSDKNALLVGSTRLSVIYSHLAVSLPEWTEGTRIFLIFLASVFAVMVAIALFVGMRLTRTITLSVANLYEATQRINRGDFTHRIPVKERDQLAALQVSFNSMTESLEKLIAEQKEKERLQSELEIAHEVQEQLFPRVTFGMATLEIHGVCRPARIVSGDYYDFLPSGTDQLGIAVGDISGKGISAALLMATIHSAVRAYEQEPFMYEEAAASPAREGSGSALATRRIAASPAHMLTLLNRHLYRSTQPEKYATLFLGFYDGESHRMTYSNAGHLPPIVLGVDGSVRRLDAGGMVVGLFDDVEYEERSADFKAGDIFIAFSDGITEPENEFGEFGEARLIETVAAYRHLPLVRITEHVIAAVQDWIGSTEQPDDVTLVLARRLS